MPPIVRKKVVVKKKKQEDVEALSSNEKQVSSTQQGQPKKIIRKVVRKKAPVQKEVVQEIKPVIQKKTIKKIMPQTESQVKKEPPPVEEPPKKEPPPVEEPPRKEPPPVEEPPPEEATKQGNMASMFSRLMEGKDAYTEEEKREIEERKRQKELENQEPEEELPAEVVFYSKLSSSLFCTVTDGKITHINQAGLDMLRYKDKELVLNRDFTDFISDDYKKTFINSLGLLLEEEQSLHVVLEGLNRRKTHVNVRALLIQNNPEFVYAIEAVNISSKLVLQEAKEKAEQMLIKASGYDSVTNLPTRKFFDDRLERLVSRSLRLSGGYIENVKFPISVMTLDIDGFSSIVNSYGEAFGDRLLSSVALRVLANIDEADTLARGVDDQFLLIIEGKQGAGELLQNTSDIVDVANHILSSLKQPFIIDAETVPVSFSLGVSFFPKHGKSASKLLRSAQKALDYIKKQGGSNFILYNEKTME